MKSKRVLIIEDDVDLLEIETYQLKENNYDVSSAQNIKEALQILNSETFDCILLDMNLHASSGKDIIIEIKSDSSHLSAKTPIIVTSGSLNIDLIKEVKEKIHSVLVKPFSTQDLLDKVNQAVKASHLDTNTIEMASKKSVFIVDDDNDYVKDLKKYLEGDHFKVIASTSTHEALAKLQNQKFDMILLDLKIDQHNGDWLVNLLRNDKGHLNHKTPIIIVTGSSIVKTQRLTKLVQEIVEKPVSFPELTQRIQANLIGVQKPILVSILDFPKKNRQI
ncbi:MAG: response regulator [Bdellovibrionaceae bacterium]|nr:response regulator [Pseudobdellovibrionaceae bacterium]